MVSHSLIFLVYQQDRLIKAADILSTSRAIPKGKFPSQGSFSGQDCFSQVILDVVVHELDLKRVTRSSSDVPFLIGIPLGIGSPSLLVGRYTWRHQLIAVDSTTNTCCCCCCCCCYMTLYASYTDKQRIWPDTSHMTQARVFLVKLAQSWAGLSVWVVK